VNWHFYRLEAARNVVSNIFPMSTYQLLKVRDPNGVKRLHHCVDRMCFHPVGNKKAFIVEQRNFHRETTLSRAAKVTPVGCYRKR